jgi:hypothetical protein
MYTSDTMLNYLTSSQHLKIATAQPSLVFYKLEENLEKIVYFYHFSGPNMEPVYLPPYLCSPCWLVSVRNYKAWH